jgi:hypothetical protein
MAAALGEGHLAQAIIADNLNALPCGLEALEQPCLRARSATEAVLQKVLTWLKREGFFAFLTGEKVMI